jgi:hypothetical protein
MNTKKKDFTKKLHVEITEEQYDILQQHCLTYKLTKAEVVRKLIEGISACKVAQYD